MNCIEDVLESLDTSLKQAINIDKIKSYGLTTRHFNDKDKKAYNLADVSIIAQDGEIAYWDDKFNIIWFHRINSINYESNNKGYASSSYIPTFIYNVSTVIAAKREVTKNGQYQRINQLDVMNGFIGVIQKLDKMEINYTEMDISRIERDEFSEGRTSKEWILLRIDFEIHRQQNNNCSSSSVCNSVCS